MERQIQFAMYQEKDIAGVKNFLKKSKQTLSIAESVTSGHLQAALSLADGATEFFQGGITAYNIVQKTKLLHVDHIHALQCNCVSDKISEQMALQCAKLFSSDWAIGITGYATPIPELGIQDLFAHYAIAFQNTIVKTNKIHSTKKRALEVQIDYTEIILREFNEYLKSVDSSFERVPQNINRM
jgi:nicotinamide-nucleotide amidase